MLHCLHEMDSSNSNLVIHVLTYVFTNIGWPKPNDWVCRSTTLLTIRPLQLDLLKMVHYHCISLIRQNWTRFLFKQVHQTSVRMIVVQVGTNYDKDDLNAIGTDPDCTTVHYSKGFQKLLDPAVISQIHIQICESKRLIKLKSFCSCTYSENNSKNWVNSRDEISILGNNFNNFKFYHLCNLTSRSCKNERNGADYPNCSRRGKSELQNQSLSGRSCGHGKRETTAIQFTFQEMFAAERQCQIHKIVFWMFMHYCKL